MGLRRELNVDVAGHVQVREFHISKSMVEGQGQGESRQGSEYIKNK